MSNMVHLRKEEKVVLEEFTATLKSERKDLRIRELTEALKKLKK
jgi:hypothetical protein